MELRRYVLLLRQRLVLVILTAVAGVAGGYLITSRAPLYQAQTSIIVTSRQPASQAGADVIQLDRIIATYAAMVKSGPVANLAISGSHVPRTPGQVVGETTAVVIPNTNLIAITVADSDPAVAQLLANGVAAGFITQVQSLNPANGTSPISTPAVTIVQPAGLPAVPIATSLKRNLALGGLFGLIVSIGVVLLVDYVDISIKSADDLEHQGDLPVLGTVPLSRTGSLGPLPMAP